MKKFINKKLALCLATSTLVLSMGFNANAKTKTLRVWDYLTGAGDVYDEWEKLVAADFKKTTGAKLIWVHKDNAPYKVSIKVSMKSNDAPDVFQYWGGKVAADFINAGYSYDMTSFVKQLKAKNYTTPAFYDLYGVYKGKNYGYTLFQNTKYLYYNKKLFAKYSLTPPKTFKDLINICKISKKKNSRMIPFGLGNLTKWRAIHIVSQLNAYYVPMAELKKDYFGDSSIKKIFTNPGYIKSLERLKEMKDNKCFERSPNTTKNDVIASLFENNKTLTEYSGTWNNSRYLEALGKNLGTVTRLPLPNDAIVKNVQEYNLSAASGFMIHKGTKVLSLSKAFVNSMAKYHNVLYKHRFSPAIIKDLKTIKHGVYAIDVYMDHVLSETYLTDVQSLIGGSMTPKQVMQDVHNMAVKLNK